MASKLIDGLHENPVVAAIDATEDVEFISEYDTEVIFVLKSNIFSLKETIEKLNEYKKTVFIHFDLVEGLSKDEVGLRYLVSQVKIDGIISTNSKMIACAKKLGILTIQRLFIIDSLSLKTGIKSVMTCDPDAVEVLPGILPKVNQKIIEATRKPLITGGLIETKEDVITSLNSGAMGISTSKKELWEI